MRPSGDGRPATPKKGVPLERLFFQRVADLPGLTVFGADHSARLWRTYHETYTVCTVLPSLPGATAEWRYRGRSRVTRPLELMLMEPGELHVTTKAHGAGSFRVLMVPPPLVQDAAHELGLGAMPHLGVSTAVDPELYDAFRTLHACIEEPSATTLERQSRLASAFRTLIARATEGGHRLGHPPAVPRRSLSHARDLIRDRFATNVTLDEIARASELSRFHIARLFAREFGVPPHQYLILVRLARAQKLLDRGLSPAATAVEAGFADQSHLTRQFKRVWGLTPGQYAAAVLQRKLREQVSLQARVPGCVL